MVRRVYFWLGVGIVIRLLGWRYFTYYPDVNTYQLWSLDVIRYGFGHFYEHAISDYLPGYIYILWFFGKIFYFLNAKVFIVPAELLFKLPSIITDTLNAVLIFLILRKETTQRMAGLISALYYLHPVVIFNSTFWGQSDSIVMFFLLAGLYFCQKNKLVGAAVFLALGQITKPVVIFAIPFYLVYVYARQKRWKDMLKFGGVFCGVYFGLFLPFASQGSLLDLVTKRNIFTSGFWNYTSMNAFNFWGLLASDSRGILGQVSDLDTFLGLTYRVWGLGMFIGVYGMSIWRLIKSKEKFFSDLVALLGLVYVAQFLFLTRMHERHGYYALVFLLLSVPFGKKSGRWISGVFGVTLLLNILYSYQAARIVLVTLPSFVPVVCSLINIYVFFLLSRRGSGR